MITLTNLSFIVNEGDRQRKILDIPTHVFESSKINVVSGPSGSGKTTLLYALGGILSINSGKVEIDGTSLYELVKDQRDNFRMDYISMIYQNHNLLSFMTVEENILMPYYVKGLKVDLEVKKRVAKYLEMMNLENIQQKSINSLSGGEQQRVSIIRAIIRNPRVILCDEPTASLDSENTVRFMESLKLLRKDNKPTIIIATHDEKVISYSENKIYMVDGKIIN